MIQKARVRQNPYGVQLYKSTQTGYLLVGDLTIEAGKNSTTISRRPITEVPEGVLPKGCTAEEAKVRLSKMIREKGLLPAEVDCLKKFCPEAVKENKEQESKGSGGMLQ